MDADPLGRAILDYERGGLRGDCLYRDGAETWDGHIYENYFRPPEEWRDEWKDLLDSLDRVRSSISAVARDSTPNFCKSEAKSSQST